MMGIDQYNLNYVNTRMSCIRAVKEGAMRDIPKGVARHPVKRCVTSRKTAAKEAIRTVD